jgi:outer membrane murein-binding lipoprotein Lpp
MAKHMTRMAAAAVAATCLIPFVLAGCSTKRPNSQASREHADLNAPIAKAGATIQRYRIHEWSAPNDHTVIIVATDGTRYRAETLGPCNGLTFSSRVGFANRGGFNTIDRTSSVVLADGTRCPFMSFDELRSPESKALDAYEKASESKPNQDSTAKSDKDKSK